MDAVSSQHSCGVVLMHEADCPMQGTLEVGKSGGPNNCHRRCTAKSGLLLMF